MAKRKECDTFLKAAKAAGVGIAQKDVTSRHGAAVHEWLSAYDGVNYAAGFTPRAPMQKSIKSVAKSKVNRRFQDSNVKQQAGFDAEIIETTRARAKSAARGARPDMLRMDDAGPKGSRRANDQFIDITKVDVNGNPIPGSGYQMKFVGSDPDGCLNKLLGTKCEKYLDKGVNIAIPSDYYDAVKSRLESKTADLEKQIEACRKSGGQIPESKQRQLERCRRLKRRLRKSTVSNEEALAARRTPKGFTAKEVGRQAHRAGIEGARASAGIAGTMSLLKNLVSVVRGDKSWKEAAADTAKETLVAGAGGYFTATGGAAISGFMMKSSNSVVRAMGKSGLPGVAITFVLAGATTLGKYFSGEMRASECMDELASLGTSMAVGSAASMGVASIPGATALTVGGVAVLPMAGTILASMATVVLLNGLKNWVYRDAQVAESRALEVERQCAEACRKLEDYRRQIDGYLTASNSKLCRFMMSAIAKIDSADYETSLAGANEISSACGACPLVQTTNDVDALMSNSFKIGR